MRAHRGGSACSGRTGAERRFERPRNGFYDLTLLYANLKDGVGNMGAALHDSLGRQLRRTLSG